ncbi:MAG: uncharacterized protein A8A55_0344 [Amphiamblys sp. WSBS2006]|nr:MAG: uncharacterized protein A8A55_0344 [Amphiamblys sp. WSBS2006]
MKHLVLFLCSGLYAAKKKEEKEERKEDMIYGIYSGPSEITSSILRRMHDAKMKGVFFFSPKELVNASEEGVQELVKKIHGSKMFVGLYFDEISEADAETITEGDFLKKIDAGTKMLSKYIPQNVEPKLFMTPFAMSKKHREWGKKSEMIGLNDTFKKPSGEKKDPEDAVKYYSDILKDKNHKKGFISFNEKDKNECIVLSKLIDEFGQKSPDGQKKVGFDKDGSEEKEKGALEKKEDAKDTADEEEKEENNGDETHTSEDKDKEDAGVALKRVFSVFLSVAVWCLIFG